MGYKQRKGISDKSRTFCLVFFVVEFLIVIICYLIENLYWKSSGITLSGEIRLLIVLTLFVLQAAGFIVCIFFKSLSIVKKILILLGLVTISLGILGTSGLVFQKEISFIDAVYKTFQLFVGEFGDLTFEIGSFPLMLNISRFLAFFVTFGTIIIILLREKLGYLSVKLFYRDVLLITDEMNPMVVSLKNRYISCGRKVVIGLVNDNISLEYDNDDNVPVIGINADKNLDSCLRRCNAGKSRNIYLICQNTSINIQIFRGIHLMFIGSDQEHDHGETESLNPYVNNISDLISCLSHSSDEATDSPKKQNSYTKKSRTTICYIHYQKDSEREFYSLEEKLTIRSQYFESYFINFYDTAIRQMISLTSLYDIAGIEPSDSPYAVTDKLRNIKVGVSGSGQLLERTVNELAKLFVFKDSPPLEIYFLRTDSQPACDITLPKRLSDIVNIKEYSLIDQEKIIPAIDLLMICSNDNVEIRSIIHSIFQNEIHVNTAEIVIISGCNTSQFSLLQKFIRTISDHIHSLGFHPCPVIKFANTMDLALSIESFYKIHGPTSREIHSAYIGAMRNGNLVDFNRLPEIFIESNILSSIHDMLILEVLNRYLLVNPGINMDVLITNELMEFFAATEHERWYNERYLRNYRFSPSPDYILNRNPYLLHWSDLDEQKRKSNVGYLIGSLVSQQTRALSHQSEMQNFLKGILLNTFDSGNSKEE